MGLMERNRRKRQDRRNRKFGSNMDFNADGGDMMHGGSDYDQSYYRGLGNDHFGQRGTYGYTVAKSNFL